MDKNDNFSKTELRNQKKKNKVLKKIDKLRSEASRLGIMKQSLKFVQLQFKKIGLERDNDSTGFFIPDGQAELNDELRKLCQKTNQMRFVFEINSTEKNNDLYAIEILVDENGHGKLGKTSLSIAVDVQGILSQYPIDDLNNVKHILKNCKHQVDCYLCRLKQFKEFEDLLSGIKNTIACHDASYTIIKLFIVGLKSISTNEFYDIILHMYYEFAATRPYKLKLDLDDFFTHDNEIPSSIILEKLGLYFQTFLKESLSQAFIKIIELDTEFKWPNDNEDVIDESDDGSTKLLANSFYQDYKERHKKSKDKVQNEKITIEVEMDVLPCVEKENSEDIIDIDSTTTDASSEIV